MRDRALVGERDVDGLSLPDVDDRAGSTSRPGPRRVLDSGRDLDGDVLEDEVVLRNRANRGCGQLRGKRRVLIARSIALAGAAAA